MAAVMPLLVFIWPAGSNKKLDIPIKLDKPMADIANGEGLKFEAPSETGFEMTTGQGDNAPGKIAFAGFAVKDDSGNVNVFAINCPHLGCSINLNASQHRFECPCHGSMFNIAGQVTHGPAIYPLAHLGWKQGDNADQIIVGGVQLKGTG